MKKLLMIAAMVAVIGMAGAAEAYTYLVDIGTAGSTLATANDFATEPTGSVPGLTGSEPVDRLNTATGAGPHTSDGGIVVSFSGGDAANQMGYDTTETAGMGALLQDWSDALRSNITVSVRNVALDPSTVCTLYLWGNTDGFSWGPSWYENSAFTPINNADVTFASTATANYFLAVDFTTSAAWDDVNSTIQFTWGPGPQTSQAYQAFNAFAITGPGSAVVVPEPAGLGLIGLALLAVRRRCS